MGNPHALGKRSISPAMTLHGMQHCSDGRALGVEPILQHISSDLLSALRPELLGRSWG
ncbi:MAG: hypothetical protein ACLS8R_03745 [Anaeromassilibacillus sp.]